MAVQWCPLGLKCYKHKSYIRPTFIIHVFLTKIRFRMSGEADVMVSGRSDNGYGYEKGCQVRVWSRVTVRLKGGHDMV